MTCANPECCCNCKSQKPISKHPANKRKLFKGSCNEQFGWVCDTAELGVCFFENQHGLCELYEKKGTEGVLNAKEPQ